MSCTTRLRSAPKVAPVPRKPFMGGRYNTVDRPFYPQISDSQ
jgi:hypothetical protein